MKSVEDRLFPLLARELRVPDGAISSSLGAGDIAEWDSLAHMRIVVAIQKEFGVVFDDDEIIGLENVAEMIELLRAKERAKQV